MAMRRVVHAFLAFPGSAIHGGGHFKAFKMLQRLHLGGAWKWSLGNIRETHTARIETTFTVEELEGVIVEQIGAEGVHYTFAHDESDIDKIDLVDWLCE